ncbi:hypothetical protein [Streptomyces olivochromogenes]|uniref:Uncharacterized protein n=1 Tax=Streptomyces olivochromogenes TaxID=1963 RepID=A0A250VN32_STROL|nr:hypothetical protein [Streptomyces olivochromogenes]KUN41425.1 hypothetical protein AQJ27_39065 [Streptomyces olivochromogenes]GAX55531.1 hypothetical protein SO3561_07090 [Streptomyces olivochromogenes]
MTHAETHLALHHTRAAELRAQAEAHRLAASARRPGELRTRLGWTLVEVGLRLAAAPRVAVAH